MREKLKVFIVDDSVLFLDRLNVALTELHGVNVIGKAKNGYEAIELIEKLLPDLVILDIRMPGKSGIDVLRQIKGDIPSIKMMILTNYPYPQYKEKAVKEGVDYFFNKSLDIEKALLAVKNLSNHFQDRTTV